MFLIYSTKNEIFSAKLIRLLLFRAGVEQNPGPWFCNICTKRLSAFSVQCDSCHKWIHIKYSGLKSTQERTKFNTWYGPYCPPPPPAPPLPPAPPTDFVGNLNILQYNINGISGKLDELLHYMEKDNIKIAAIQETKLTDKSKLPNINKYNMVGKSVG